MTQARRKADLQTDLDKLALGFAEIAMRAGTLIMEVYRCGFEINSKCDGSPVTDADEQAEREVLKGLRTLLPGVQIVAEEACAARLETSVGDEFLLVDALDGTAEFIKRRGDFTVNIALIKGDAPVAGCVFSPSSGELYIGGTLAASGRVGEGQTSLPTFRTIAARVRPMPMVAAISRSHLDPETEDFLAHHAIGDTVVVGSSIKFCRIAEGMADVYPRFGRTMEWDTAAGHAVLAAAGGAILDPNGKPLRYGKVNGGFANGPFVAWGRYPERPRSKPRH